jgi:hypothetical protein
MSLVSEASKLLTNKYFLYFMVFLATTNVLGYLVTNKTNAVIFFALVSLLTYQFSKNMAVILLVAIIATNFLMANKRMREGLENGTTTSETTIAPSVSNLADKDIDLAKATAVLHDPKIKTNSDVANVNNGNIKQSLANTVAASNEPLKTKPNKIPSDPNNPSSNQTTEPEEVEGFGEKMSGKKGAKTESFGPRLDYAATIEESYGNLDKLLGSDAISQLTSDTQNLMKQQQTLFNTMNQMVPVLEGAQNMLKGFDVGSLTNSLKNIGGLANAPLPVTNK